MDADDARPISRIHVAELDGLRGIAVALVLVWHYINVPLQFSVAFGGTPPGWALRASSFGWAGVDLFFVLSGFLIGGILLDRVASGQRWSRGFYLRRAARILPPYFILLLAVILLRQTGLPKGPLLGQADTQLWPYFAFLQNYNEVWQIKGRPWALNITWTLAVEEQFYLVFPLLVWLLRARLGLVAALALIVAMVSILWRAAAGPSGGSYVMTHFRLDGLAFGVLVAVFIRSAAYRRIGGMAAWLAAAIALLSLISFANHWQSYTHGEARVHLEFALMGAAVVFLAWHGRGHCLWGVLRRRTLMGLGEISYTLYLVHLLIAGLVFLAYRGADMAVLQRWRDGVALVCALLISIGISVLMRSFVEQPLRRWARRRG